MKQITGQISLFDSRPKNEKNIGLGEPCESCDIEWCSIKCFIRRGYVWDKLHRFAKRSNGEKLRTDIETRKCKETRFDLRKE